MENPKSPHRKLAACSETQRPSHTGARASAILAARHTRRAKARHARQHAQPRKRIAGDDPREHGAPKTSLYLYLASVCFRPLTKFKIAVVRSNPLSATNVKTKKRSLQFSSYMELAKGRATKIIAVSEPLQGKGRFSGVKPVACRVSLYGVDCHT